jgi:hypothetical protein
MTTSSIETSAKSASSSDGDILAGYVEQAQFAHDHRISPRTVARYRNQADGLPSVEFGGKIYIPIDDAASWLRNRIRHPNKRRNG